MNDSWFHWLMTGSPVETTGPGTLYSCNHELDLPQDHRPGAQQPCIGEGHKPVFSPPVGIHRE